MKVSFKLVFKESRCDIVCMYIEYFVLVVFNQNAVYKEMHFTSFEIYSTDFVGYFGGIIRWKY